MEKEEEADMKKNGRRGVGEQSGQRQLRLPLRGTRASCAGNRLRARHLNSIFVPGEQKIVELVPQLVFVVRNQ
jgi:hypothetical protein